MMIDLGLKYDFICVGIINVSCKNAITGPLQKAARQGKT